MLFTWQQLIHLREQISCISTNILESICATWDTCAFWPNSLATRFLTQEPYCSWENQMILNFHTQPIRRNVYYYKTDSSLTLVRPNSSIFGLPSFLGPKPSLVSTGRVKQFLPMHQRTLLNHIYNAYHVAVTACLQISLFHQREPSGGQGHSS